MSAEPDTAEEIMRLTSSLRWTIKDDFRQALVEATYAEAGRLTDRAVTHEGRVGRFQWDRTLDRLVTSRLWGFPIMLGLLTVVFYLTIEGANTPSRMLDTLLVQKGVPLLHSVLAALAAPWWVSGFLVDGVYLGMAWVIAVMLPPMAIFFPLFTLLEDFGYLPRVAFNLDLLFKKAGAHGKQALTMSMGFGCNAAGVVATRIIDSPRERLIAIITNNFAVCNGRWGTLILVSSIFIGALAPPGVAGVAAAGAVVGVTMFGVVLTFLISWILSRTVLQGEASTFSLELPPYRPPRFWQTIYTSLIDRTLIVLGRAIIFAAPCGGLIWLSCHLSLGGDNIAAHLIHGLDGFGLLIGLNGVILLAYILAIPANEIIVPTILMLTVMTARVAGAGAGTGVMFETDTDQAAAAILIGGGGWTLLTAVNLMIFCLVHNPCSTTIYTIWKETRSVKWTVVASLMPVVLGLSLCFVVAQIWRIFAG